MLFGQFSESIARFIGTARFLVWQTIVIIVWLAANMLPPEKYQFDPWDRGLVLLTLVLSLQAAYAAPLILLAQNRQERRDRVASEQDREVAERTQADTEFLAREIASVRFALADVVTGEELARRARPAGRGDRALNARLDGMRGARRLKPATSPGCDALQPRWATPVNSCSRTPKLSIDPGRASVGTDCLAGTTSPAGRLRCEPNVANAAAVAAAAVPTSSATPTIRHSRPPSALAPRTSTRSAPIPPSWWGGLEASAAER